jgi:hypothetical protein
MPPDKHAALFRKAIELLDSHEYMSRLQEIERLAAKRGWSRERAKLQGMVLPPKGEERRLADPTLLIIPVKRQYDDRDYESDSWIEANVANLRIVDSPASTKPDGGEVTGSLWYTKAIGHLFLTDGTIDDLGVSTKFAVEAEGHGRKPDRAELPGGFWKCIGWGALARIDDMEGVCGAYVTQRL